MREIIINGYDVSSYYMGVVGEHNATKLIITPPSELINDNISYYRVLFKLRNKTGPLVTQKYYSYPIEVPLVQALTINTSFALCILSYDSDGKYVAISKKLENFYFNPSDYNALADHINECLDDPLIGLQEILDGKADKDYIDDKLDEKADVVYVDEIADELEEQLENKADIGYIDDKLDTKVDKEEGKGLSTFDFDFDLRTKLMSAYNDRHRHANKPVLDDLSDNQDKLYYNGELVGLEPLTNAEMISICRILVDE